MRSPLFDLPVEILDQIFLNAISVRTYSRAARLRLVCCAFENYTTRVILHDSMYAVNARPERATDTTSREWRDMHLQRLAQHLCKLRPHPEGAGPNPESETLLSLEHVIRVDIFKAQWIDRNYLLDQLDDGSWNPYEITSDLLDVAVWLDDIDLIHHLLPIEEAELQDDARRAARLSGRLLMAAEHNNLETLKFLHSRACGPNAKLPSKTILSLLVRGYLSDNPSLFQFALDEYNDEDPIPVDQLGYVLQYCPSSRSYRQVLGMMWERDEFYFDPRSPIGCDLQGIYRLARAAMQGHLELVEYFVDGVVPFDHPDRQRGLENETDELERYRFLGLGLLFAIRGGSLPVVEYMLDNGSSPHTYPCLNAAIRRGSREIVELLVWYGADVTRGFPPPISIAVVQEDMDLFRYLLEKGALSEGIGWFGGAWAMAFAKLLGLDSMVAELIQAGVLEDSRIDWVPTRDEEQELPWRPQNLRFTL